QVIRQQLDSHLGEPGLIRLHRLAPAISPALLFRDLDLVLWLMGRTPEAVHAFGGTDFHQVHLGFPGGGMALIGCAAGPAFTEGYSSLSAIARAGAAYADDQANRQLLFTGGAAHALRSGEGVVALASMVQAFIDTLLTGDDLSGELAGWCRVLAVRDAVTQSLATGRAIHSEGH